MSPHVSGALGDLSLFCVHGAFILSCTNGKGCSVLGSTGKPLLASATALVLSAPESAGEVV